MNQTCSNCIYFYTYKECTKCRNGNNFTKGDPKLHFLSQSEPSKICTFYTFGEEGCNNCSFKLKCLLLKKETDK